jgi:four helix bundle protein
MAGEMGEKKYDLEDRLIDFAVRIVRIADRLPKTRTCNHIAGQITRCGTSSAPNYGEAQGAESHDDFVHKIRLCLKELRETRVWLKIIQRINPSKMVDDAAASIDECNQLISIFVASIRTSRKKHSYIAIERNNMAEN